MVVVESRGEFYPPAAALAGIELSQLIVVRVRSAQDAIWAIDQALRCPAVGSVVCWTERFDQRGRRQRVEVLRCRGAAAGGAVELELDHETSALPTVVSPSAQRRNGT